MKFTFDVWMRILLMLPEMMKAVQEFFEKFNLSGMGQTKATIVIQKVAQEIGQDAAIIGPLIQPVIDAQKAFMKAFPAQPSQ